MNVGLADKQLISKYNKGFPFLSCAIDIFSKYTWAPSFKNQNGITVTNVFVKKSNIKPNKIWIDKGSEFYNRSLKSWLQDNCIKCIQHIKKGNLLLLKDLLEP